MHYVFVQSKVGACTSKSMPQSCIWYYMVLSGSTTITKMIDSYQIVVSITITQASYTVYGQ